MGIKCINIKPILTRAMVKSTTIVSAALCGAKISRVKPDLTLGIPVSCAIFRLMIKGIWLQGEADGVQSVRAGFDSLGTLPIV